MLFANKGKLKSLYLVECFLSDILICFFGRKRDGKKKQTRGFCRPAGAGRTTWRGVRLRFRNQGEAVAADSTFFYFSSFFFVFFFFFFFPHFRAWKRTPAARPTRTACWFVCLFVCWFVGLFVFFSLRKRNESSLQPVPETLRGGRYIRNASFQVRRRWMVVWTRPPKDTSGAICLVDSKVILIDSEATPKIGLQFTISVWLTMTSLCLRGQWESNTKVVFSLGLPRRRDTLPSSALRTQSGHSSENSSQTSIFYLFHSIRRLAAFFLN